ncbi:MAG TPA: hemolysin family protein [Thermoanaerobaculia bacterium]|nr:hemolysin family protein [Thermoanaerobaculia bacterium]
MTVAPIFLLAAGAPPIGGGRELAPWAGLLLGLLLVLLNGFFVAAEFALVKLRPTQLEEAEPGLRVRLLQHMLAHLDAYLSASQLGITLASLALGWVGEPAFAWLLRPPLEKLGASDVLVHSIAATAAFLIIMVLHIVVGEQAPKTFAIRKPFDVSLWIVVPLHAFYRATYPAIWLLNKAANGLLQLFGVEPVTEGELGHSEEELRLLLASTEEELSQQKRELLDNVFELSHRVARQIMVPRGDVVYLSTTRGVEENLRLARGSGHTRFPLCRGSLDQAIGLIHIKDLFRHEGPPRSLEETARPLTFVPETLTLDQLLRRMRGERVHLAAVLDEYGGVSGIVTLENVIEEIVGQIQDEFDLERPELVPLGPGRYQVDAGMLVEDLEDALKIEFSERDEDTIGGVVLSELGRRPRVGDTVEVGPLRLRVADAELNRIKSIEIEVKEEEPAEKAD